MIGYGPRRDQREPRIPNETCPQIDAAINLLSDAQMTFEKLREANSELREAVAYWMERAQEAEAREDELSDRLREVA